ncbi:MAG: flagellar protein [Butyrivibrio sp.]|nr:flagellar protein [Butyrivibrio sp.]
MDINEARFTSIEQVTGRYLNQGSPHTAERGREASFEEILRKKVDLGAAGTRESEDLRFSKHAAQRLSDRNISLSREQLDRLQKGARLCGDKGIKESLVIMDEYAFIVNTQKNTVITAMEQGNDGENIFTNIDGAVLV